MNVRTSISTWAVLQELGFTPDQSVISDVMPGLSFDFGNLKLSASCILNRKYVPIVLLTGIFSTERTMAEIECEMPPEVESPEQGMAFVAWSIDNALGKEFQPATSPDWLAKGRQHRYLLPWEKERADYAAKPQCSIRRDWVRVALKTLAQQLANAKDDEVVSFSFDGRVLSIDCAGSLCAMPAKGAAWDGSYSVRAKTLRSLPRRLMTDPVEVSFWKSALTIANRQYETVEERQ